MLAGGRGGEGRLGNIPSSHAKKRLQRSAVMSDHLQNVLLLINLFMSSSIPNVVPPKETRN